MDSTQEVLTPDAPLVSVVIPSYNVAPYIAAAVDSALDQTWRNLEVIVVDDGATDGSLDVVRTLGDRRSDPRLRIVVQANGGLSAARNAGIREATGTYIGFLDGDDAWLPGKVAQQMALMASDPRIGLTFSHSSYMDEAGTPTGGALTTRTLRPGLLDMVRRNHFGNGSTVIARRACFHEAGVFDTALKSCEDYEMWCRILARTTFLAAGVPQPLTRYRLRATSLTFDPGNFTRNADLAMTRLRDLGLPPEILAAGHAMHYRIAAWRAVLAGKDDAARQLMRRALRLWPALALRDGKACVVLAAMLLPRRVRGALTARWSKFS